MARFSPKWESKVRQRHFRDKNRALNYALHHKPDSAKWARWRNYDSLKKKFDSNLTYTNARSVRSLKREILLNRWQEGRRKRYLVGDRLSEYFMIGLFAILILFTFLSSSFMVETKTMIGDNEYIQRVGLASKYDGGYYWEFDGSRLMSKLGDLKTENLFESFIAFELGYINKDDYKGDSQVGETVFAVVSAILNAVILIFNVVLSILDIIVFFIQELITVIEILVIIIKDGFVYMEPYKIPVGG